MTHKSLLRVISKLGRSKCPADEMAEKSLFLAAFDAADAAYNLKRDPLPSTFGFALSCNFYERPNVSKEWKTIIFMFHHLLALSRSLNSFLEPRSRAKRRSLKGE